MKIPKISKGRHFKYKEANVLTYKMTSNKLTPFAKINFPNKALRIISFLSRLTSGINLNLQLRLQKKKNSSEGGNCSSVIARCIS